MILYSHTHIYKLHFSFIFSEWVSSATTFSRRRCPFWDARRQTDEAKRTRGSSTTSEW